MLEAKLSLVLPAHNEADNIEAVVSRARTVLPEVVREHEIIIVDDGSHDITGDIADQLAAELPDVLVVHHPRNRGYGSALRSGFDRADGDLIMFMDADRQFDISDVTRLTPYVPQYDIVAGYRIRRRDARYRRLYAKIFDIVVWTLFGIHMRDIDCAFKIYRADLVHAMPLSMPGALINTEMLALARRMGATLVEVGVTHYPRTAGASSGGSPRVVYRAMGETLALWWRLRTQDVPAIGSGEPRPAGPRLIPAMVAIGTALLSFFTFYRWRQRN